MISIPIRVCGDHWINPIEVTQLLAQCREPVELDMGAEGASLHALGVVGAILEWCQHSNIEPKMVVVKNWPNLAESVPFQRAYQPRISHFVWMATNYIRPPVASTHKFLFGLFIGRRTLSRMCIVKDCFEMKHTLLSVMKTDCSLPWQDTTGINLENLADWVPDAWQHNFKHWWENCPINSIDNVNVNDQYNNTSNTNLSLLGFYNLFDIEIVSETYTLGDTFFLTEKTIRPISASKPFIIYGPKKFLQRLKDLGFKTFESLWDESYDEYEGAVRWQAMQSIINTFTNLPAEQQQQILVMAATIAHENREHLLSLIEKYKPQ